MGSNPTAIAISPAGAPTATITSPAGGGTYTVGQSVPTGFSCAEGTGGPGISTCVDSNRVADGAGTLDTTTAGSHTYTVNVTSQDGDTGHLSITYTVTPATITATTTATTTTPATTAPTSTPTPPTATTAPVMAVKITAISVTGAPVVWCRGQGCGYPNTRLQFSLNRATTVRLALRAHRHGHWQQVATTRIHGHPGLNLHRVAGRWHGHLYPARPVQILVQTDQDGQWKTVTTVRLTVRHALQHH